VKLGLFTVKFTTPPPIGYPKRVTYAVIFTLWPCIGDVVLADRVKLVFGDT
jgi:hypothetical protein